MIKTTLPTFTKTINGDKVVVSEREITVAIDTSLFAEERWEANFPNNAKNETLFAYIERVAGNGDVDKAHVLSHLKALYCFLEGDDIADFKSFCQMFDIAEPTRLAKLIEKIKYVFGVVLASATADSKN